MNGPEVTFFMIVTDNDVTIADRCITSYRRIAGIDFRLVVYSNWIAEENKRRYFPSWKAFEYVVLIENNQQTDDKRPDPLANAGLEGPYEKMVPIWDRELVKLETPFFGTVDADFEILNGSFVNVMLEELRRNPRLVGISTDHSPTSNDYIDARTGDLISLEERWHTWFCLYRREALACEVSWAYHEERAEGAATRRAWDTAGWRQHSLIADRGFLFAALDARYQRQFIHYAAFSKNTTVTERNVDLYRFLAILRKRGIRGRARRFLRLPYDLVFGRSAAIRTQSGHGLRRRSSRPGS